MAEAVVDKVMTKKHREILRKHRTELEDNLQPLKLLKHLTRVLSPEDEEDIRAERTTTEQARRLLNILPRKGDQAFEAFVRALERTQKFLAKPIAEEGDIELSNAKDGYNGHCMKYEHKELLRSNWEVLRNINLDKILPLMEVFFDKEDLEQMNSKASTTGRFREFLTILGKKEDDAFCHFVKILNITNPSIARFLVREKSSVNTADEEKMSNPTQLSNPEDDTEIGKVKDKLTTFCQKTNEDEGWKKLAQNFQVPINRVENSSNQTLEVLKLVSRKKVGELKQTLTHLQMTANKKCLMKDLMKRPDEKDSPGAPPDVVALTHKTEKMVLADESDTPNVVTTFGELTDENQKNLVAEIDAEKKTLKYDIEIPLQDELQKYKIRDLTNLLRGKRMLNTIRWMKGNLPKGITGPLHDENMNVRDMPYSKRSKLTVQLCANDHWKELACYFGLTTAEIQYFDSHRFKNPADEVLKQWEIKRNSTVGDLYDILVKLNMPVIADAAL